MSLVVVMLLSNDKDGGDGAIQVVLLKRAIILHNRLRNVVENDCARISSFLPISNELAQTHRNQAQKTKERHSKKEKKRKTNELKSHKQNPFC